MNKSVNVYRFPPQNTPIIKRLSLEIWDFLGRRLHLRLGPPVPVRVEQQEFRF